MGTLRFRRIAIGMALALASGLVQAQTPFLQLIPEPGAKAFVVFVQSRPIGREELAVVRQADAWIVRGNSRLGPPVNTVMRSAEIRYDADWRPIEMALEGTLRGQEVSVRTTFAAGKATNDIRMADTPPTKIDDVSADAVVLPNWFLGSYAALARRLPGSAVGTVFHGYIAPQAEVPMKVDGIFPERIETPQRAIESTRYALSVSNPGATLQANIWVTPEGEMLRFSVPLQGLEVAREDIASAASRTTSFSLPNDESVRIPAAGFNLAGSVTKPTGVTTPLPAVVLIGGSGPTDRDSFVFGIPIMGHIARALVEAGFLVVRYDKRGVGQSGGRAEAATIGDYVEDARSVVAWLDKRKDVDKRRIGLVGHSEGAWVAMALAARDKRVRAIALLAAPSAAGSEIVLEQQQRLLDQLKTSEADRKARIDLQMKINAAVLGRGSWEGIPAPLRNQADTPWFHSYLSFNPANVVKDVRQPMLIVQGELDTQVLPAHADKLEALARARKHKATVDVVKVPGINHLLVPATTGEVDEYTTLTEKTVSSVVTSAIALWMAKALG